MHADFGCNLNEFLFEQKTNALKMRISSRIQTQLSKWLPFLSMPGLQIIFSEDDPSVPDPGMGLRLQLTYGNIPIGLFLMFPVT